MEPSPQTGGQCERSRSAWARRGGSPGSTGAQRAHGGHAGLLLRAHGLARDGDPAAADAGPDPARRGARGARTDPAAVCGGTKGGSLGQIVGRPFGLSILIAGSRLSLPQRCTARWLYDAGLRTVEAIAQLPDEEELVHILSKPRAGADHGRCGTWRVVHCHVRSENVCLERNINPSSQVNPRT